MPETKQFPNLNGKCPDISPFPQAIRIRNSTFFPSYTSTGSSNSISWICDNPFRPFYFNPFSCIFIQLATIHFNCGIHRWDLHDFTSQLLQALPRFRLRVRSFRRYIGINDCPVSIFCFRCSSNGNYRDIFFPGIRYIFRYFRRLSDTNRQNAFHIRIKRASMPTFFVPRIFRNLNTQSCEVIPFSFHNGKFRPYLAPFRGSPSICVKLSFLCK